MSTEPQRRAPHLVAHLPLFARRWAIAGLVVVAAAVLVPVGVWAASNHPDGLNRSRVERRIAQIYGRPDEGTDDKIDGDILIERFYAVDAESGQRYVADVVKGRVKGLQSATNDLGTTYYTFVLERQSLQGRKQALRNFVQKLAPPPVQPPVAYLGLVVLPGTDDAILVNYDGTIPVSRQPFFVWNHRALYDTLLSLPVGSIPAPQLMPNKGYNFLISTTELWPYFRTAFNVQNAVWVSEEILIDATSPEHRLMFYQKLSDN